MKLSLKQLTVGMIIGLVLLIFFIGHSVGMTQPLENIVVRIVQPLQRTLYGWSLGLGQWYQAYRETDGLRRQNQELRDALTGALVDQARLRLVEEEDAFLRDQLAFKEKGLGTPVVSRVIGRSTDDASNIIIIDQGSKSGITVGYPVIVGQGVLVGKVLTVNDYNATVLLINDHSAQVAASILTVDRTIGVVRGEYGLGLKMELIPQTENVQEQDIVITSGIETSIPRGLVIGTIDTVTASMEELFKNAVIRMPVDVETISLVSVLRPSTP
jgi:rod shape-determining protein MreC